MTGTLKFFFFNLRFSILQSSCTKPELDTEGPDTECVQDLSCSKRSKPTLRDMDVQKYEECHNVGERDRACNKDEGMSFVLFFLSIRNF